MNRSLFVWLLGVALVSIQPAMAIVSNPSDQRGTDSAAFAEEDPYEKPEHKEPSFWHHADAATPAAQLAFARQCEQAGHRRRAIKAYDALVHVWHSAPEALQAQASMARLLEDDGQFEEAFAEYQYLIAYFSGQFDFLSLLDHQYRCANACHGTSGRTFAGLKIDSASGARKMYERLLINGPHWSKAPEIGLLIGSIRENEKEIPEAIAAYEQVLNRYPGTDAAHEAALRAALCRYHFSVEHPRDEQSRVHAITALAAFLHAYPLDPQHDTLTGYRNEMDRAQMDACYDRAVFYDLNRHDRAAAIAAYYDFLRLYPDAPHAKEAAKRLERLENATRLVR